MNIPYLLAEFRHRPGRTLATLLSVALGVALFLSLQAYASGYRRAARTPLSEIGADLAAQRQGAVPEAFVGPVFPHSVSPIHHDEIELIRTLPGVEAVAEALLFWEFGADNAFYAVLGVDPSVAVGPERLRAALTQGRFLEEADHAVAVADSSFARQNSLEVGSTVSLAGEPFTVVGLVDTSRAGQVANANLYIPLADARTLVQDAPNVRQVHDIRPDDANILFIKANQSQAEAVVEAVSQQLGAEALVSSARSFTEVLGATFRLVDRFGWLVGLAGLAVAVAVLLRAVATNLWERRRDIGLMRAVGWRRRDIVRQLMGEVLTVALVGACGGIVLAILVALLLSQTQVTIPIPWELSPSPHFLPGGAHESSVFIRLPARVEPLATLIVLALTLTLSGLAGLLLSRRAAMIKPAEVLRNE